MKSTQLLSLFCLASSSLLHASDDLAAAAQNPIASMISLPIDTSVDFGADNGTAVVANIQPVIPTSLGEWNLVSRLILPVAYVEGAIIMLWLRMGPPSGVSIWPSLFFFQNRKKDRFS